MTASNNNSKYAYRVEEIANKLNLNIQVLHYITQELEDFKLPEDREPTLDDIYARVPQLCYRLLDDMKAIREELYTLFEDIR